jgi:hypothetical protein
MSPPAPFVVTIVEQLLRDRVDATEILVATADRLGVPLLLQPSVPGLAMEQPYDSHDLHNPERATTLGNLRDAHAKWHAWAVQRRRLHEVSAKIRSSKPLTSPRVTRVLSWEERDAHLRSDAMSIASSTTTMEPESLPFTTIDELPAELRASKEFQTIRTVLNARLDHTLTLWRRRSLFTDDNWQEWSYWHSPTRTHRDANDAGRVFSDRQHILTAEGLRSADTETAADAWNTYRRFLLIEIRQALVVGFSWTQLLTRLSTTLSDPEYGYQRLENYITAALSDTTLLRYPLLHADVLICKLDASYATGSRKYKSDSATVAWERADSRLPGEDLISLAVRVINAFLTKTNAASVTDITVWQQPSYVTEINERYCECVYMDMVDLERGTRNAKKFREVWRLAQITYEMGEAPATALSCEALATRDLTAFETSNIIPYHLKEQQALLPPPPPPNRQLTDRSSHQTGLGARARRDALRASHGLHSLGPPEGAYMPDQISE